MAAPSTRLIVAAVVALVLFAAALFLPVGRWLLSVVDYVRDAGAIGFVLYMVIYVAATVLFIPGSILTMAAGFLYGVSGGMALVVPAAIVGATLAFLLGRSVARDAVAERVATTRWFRAVDDVTGSDGFKIVLLLRLSPVVPFSLINYALGVTKVRTRDYVVASAIGILPGTLLYVYLGSVVTTAAQLLKGGGDSGVWGRVLFWGGLVATLVVTVLITRLARRRLARELPADHAPTA